MLTFSSHWVLKSAMDEVLWIYQKKPNNANDLNSHIWDSWADESGSIGKAYGYQVGQVSLPDGDYDQMDRAQGPQRESVQPSYYDQPVYLCRSFWR